MSIQLPSLEEAEKTFQEVSEKQYLTYDSGVHPAQATLDGWFTLEELKAIVVVMSQ